MNPQSPWARVAAITATAGLALLAAGCGTGSGSSPTAGGAANAGGSLSSQLLAYASCMRSHGVPDFPDPDSSGQIPKDAVISASRSVGTSQFQAAGNACRHLAPAALGPTPASITAQDQQYYLRAAACMRSHGITDFPDPVFSGGTVHFSIPPSIDNTSQQYVQDRQTCEKLIPAGLPGSASGG
jgi:hypothetical protein